MVALPAILSEMKMDKDGGWTVKFELSEMSGEQIAQVTKIARHKAVMIGITGRVVSRMKRSRFLKLLRMKEGHLMNLFSMQKSWTTWTVL